MSDFKDLMEDFNFNFSQKAIDNEEKIEIDPGQFQTDFSQEKNLSLPTSARLKNPGKKNQLNDNSSVTVVDLCSEESEENSSMDVRSDKKKVCFGSVDHLGVVEDEKSAKQAKKLRIEPPAEVVSQKRSAGNVTSQSTSSHSATSQDPIWKLFWAVGAETQVLPSQSVSPLDRTDRSIWDLAELQKISPDNKKGLFNFKPDPKNGTYQKTSTPESSAFRRISEPQIECTLDDSANVANSEKWKRKSDTEIDELDQIAIEYFSGKKCEKQTFGNFKEEKVLKNWSDNFAAKINLPRKFVKTVPVKSRSELPGHEVKAFQIEIGEVTSEISKFEVYFFSRPDLKKTTCWVKDLSTSKVFVKFSRWKNRENGLNLKEWLEKEALARLKEIPLKGKRNASCLTSWVKSGKWLSLENVFVSVVACLFFASRLSCRKNEFDFSLKQSQKKQKIKEKAKTKTKRPSLSKNRRKKNSPKFDFVLGVENFNIFTSSSLYRSQKSLEKQFFKKENFCLHKNGTQNFCGDFEPKISAIYSNLTKLADHPLLPSLSKELHDQFKLGKSDPCIMNLVNSKRNYSYIGSSSRSN
eukprot:GHVP01042110.1.p1 GENE.GHVP01042110.1~~GHVP01042110.1.p1  ORF type:complete len:580 (+),score=111.83 GHVP01042110.1:24-1763(+)